MTIVVPVDVEYGEVFTRRWVVDAILDLVGYTPDRDLSRFRLVEPSVGSGAFFGPVVERLLASARKHDVPLERLSKSLFGLDLRREHVETCQLTARSLLAAHGADEKVARQVIDSWLR